MTNDYALKKKKSIVIIYFITVIALIAISMLPLGYSVKNNKPENIDFTAANEVHNKKAGSRTYKEQYQIIETENIQINCLELCYNAADPNFRGILTASINEDDEVIDSSSVEILSPGSDEKFSYAKIEFGVAAQLLKGHEYMLNIQIDTNMPCYQIKEFDISNKQNFPFGLITKKSIITNIMYTPISIMRYGEAFYGFIILCIIVGGLLLLRFIDINPVNNVYIKKILIFIQEHYNEIILMGMFIYLALYEFVYAYVKGVYISPDSGSYLMEADAILNGYGFNNAGKSGYDSWFCAFPIGYPLLIAVVAFITGRNVYLSSKILAILIVGFFLLILYTRFRKNAWIYSFVLLNTGFLTIYKYTWSEIPFILGLLIFCLILDYIVEKEIIKTRWFVLLGLSSIFSFLCRYFGTLTFIIICIVFLCYGLCIFSKKYKHELIKKKLLGCVISGVLSGTFIGCYYLMNYIKTGTISGTDRSVWWDEYSELTNGFYGALISEFSNIVNMVLPDPIASMSRHFKMWLVVLFLAVILYLFYKFRPKDFRIIFIAVGIFYYLVFAFVRYHSSMDAFSYRFFAPASILIVIGLLGFAVPFLVKNKNKIAPVVIVIITLAIFGLSAPLRSFNRNNTAYSQLVVDLRDTMKDIPMNSAVFAASDFDDRIRIVRPDICYVYRSIGVSETMDALFERYCKSDYICIKAKYVKDILFYPIYDYNQSVIDFFGKVTKDTPDEEFLVISVKDRELKNCNGK